MGYEDEIRAVLERYRAAPDRARDERDAALRDIATRYELKQVDVIRATGYSRETVRQALKVDE